MSRIQNLKVEDTGLKVGEKYTLLSVSEFMANTLKTEITITAILPIQEYAQYKNVLQVNFIQRGKRKQNGFYLKDSDVFLLGWDLGLMIDSDTEKGFKGNALINLIGDKQTATDIINKTYVFGNRGIIFICLEEEFLKDDGTPLFLEQAENTAGNHAVVNRAIQQIRSPYSQEFINDMDSN